jgi:transposase-like protein
VVRQLASGEQRPAQICREQHLAESVVSRWRNEYAQRGEEAFESSVTKEPPSAAAKIAELERLCGQLALEKALLKKAVGRLPFNSAMRSLSTPARRSCPSPSVSSASWGLVNRAWYSARHHVLLEPAKLAEAVALRDAIDQILLYVDTLARCLHK